MDNTNNKGLTPFGWFAVLLFVGCCAGGAWWYFSGRGGGPSTVAAAVSGNQTLAAVPGSGPAADKPSPSTQEVAVSIAYGTEKKRWLEWAVEEFRKSNPTVKITLLPYGSIEAAKEIPTSSKKIHGWAPASSAFRDAFEQEWELRYEKKPIAREETLALTPMVYVFWQERYDAFVKKNPSIDFDVVISALRDPTGWQGLANKPEWGVFKFGHTHPNQSNSGLMTLLLQGAEYFKSTNALTMQQVLDRGFQERVAALAKSVSGLSNSTGTLIKDMVLRGPSTYDAIFVYESVAIDYLKNAQGRWGALRVVYPKYNCWSDNPFYVLNTPGETAEESKATLAFLDFLISEPAQKKALEHGFRPGNPAIPVVAPDSPFSLYSDYGLRVEINNVARIPPSEVITNLTTAWQRSQK